LEFELSSISESVAGTPLWTRSRGNTPFQYQPDEYQRLDPKERRIFLRGYYSSIFRASNWLMPPLGLAGGIGGDHDIHYWAYRVAALEEADLALSYCGLLPSGRVLDVGCGTGKLASALVYFMDENGSYDGFDIAEESVDWCSRAITSIYPNFVFRHIKVSNEAYGLEGEIAKSFTFPYESNSFDAVISCSVITHMDLASGLRYFEEIQRVLRPGGKAAVTLFILNDREVTQGGIVTRPLGIGDATYSNRFVSYEKGFFYHSDEAGRPKSHFTTVRDCGDPVAFAGDWLGEELCQRGWGDVQIEWGRWRSGGMKPPFQDVVVLTKK
jgi:SAM-dependent methyltransferase